MVRRELVLLSTVFAAAAGAAGQNYGQPVIDKSREKVIFFSGSVMLDDGSAPPEPVRIERVCDGRSSFETWTDEKGHFGFKVGANGDGAGSGDASLPGARPADLNKAINASSTQYSMPITSALKNCELHAILSGYRSENVSLAIKSVMDDARLGTILMHPLSRASALIVSATTLQAPANARKAYEKGLEAMRTGKTDAAATEFSKAVKLYPKYAIAWYQLGLIRQSRSDLNGAIDAWKSALESDPHYIKPYENLTASSDHLSNWADSEKYSKIWIQLDPEDFPAAYLFNAVANARMNNGEAAERSAREGLRLDKEHKIPRMSYVLGLILMDKKQYGESAKCFRDYLAFAPAANDAALVREQLPKIEALAVSAHN